MSIVLSVNISISHYTNIYLIENPCTSICGMNKSVIGALVRDLDDVRLRLLMKVRDNDTCIETIRLQYLKLERSIRECVS